MAEDEKPEVHETTTRRRRSTEAPVSPAATDAEPGGERNPDWPAQYDTNGWDHVPVQMRP